MERHDKSMIQQHFVGVCCQEAAAAAVSRHTRRQVVAVWAARLVDLATYTHIGCTIHNQYIVN